MGDWQAGRIGSFSGSLTTGQLGTCPQNGTLKGQHMPATKNFVQMWQHFLKASVLAAIKLSYSSARRHSRSVQEVASIFMKLAKAVPMLLVPNCFLALLQDLVCWSLSTLPFQCFRSLLHPNPILFFCCPLFRPTNLYSGGTHTGFLSLRGLCFVPEKEATVPEAHRRRPSKDDGSQAERSTYQSSRRRAGIEHRPALSPHCAQCSTSAELGLEGEVQTCAAHVHRCKTASPFRLVCVCLQSGPC